MLTNALRALVNNLFKKSFYEKKNSINVLTVFFFILISHKNVVKTFLKQIVNQYPKSILKHDFYKNNQINSFIKLIGAPFIHNWEILTSALRTLVNNSFQESFDITFMENEKNCQNINCFFFFFHKFFFNWIINQCPKDTCQHDPS